MNTEQQMSRVKAGDVLTARILTTIDGDRIQIPDPDGPVHLQFRRFASCPICNVHLRTFMRRHGELLAAGVRVVAVFHSDREAMLPHLRELPFATIPDPDFELYAEFGIEFSRKAVLDPRAWTSPLKPYAWRVGLREALAPGGSLFSTRGGSTLGMPADLLVRPNGVVQAVKYGTHANDQWSVDEVIALATG